MRKRTYELRERRHWENCKAHIRAIREQGKTPRVVVSIARKRRSLDQNALLHVLIQDLAQEIGFSLDDVKTWLKEQYGPKHIVRIAGRDVAVPRSTADYNTVECTDFIDRIYQVAAEAGVVLPTPDEYRQGAA